MTTTKPAEEATAAPPTLGMAQYLGYAAGDVANNLAFSMTSMFLLIYYTDVVGISAAAAGSLFLIIRIWDGFADIFAGQLVDKTNTRWGKFRPFFLFGAAPLLLLSLATFTVPALVKRHRVGAAAGLPDLWRARLGVQPGQQSLRVAGVGDDATPR